MNTPTRKLGLAIPSILLALLAVTLLWPPGPYSPRAYTAGQRRTRHRRTGANTPAAHADPTALAAAQPAHDRAGPALHAR